RQLSLERKEAEAGLDVQEGLAVPEEEDAAGMQALVEVADDAGARLVAHVDEHVATEDDVEVTESREVGRLEQVADVEAHAIAEAGDDVVLALFIEPAPHDVVGHIAAEAAPAIAGLPGGVDDAG